jgi:hypothetical protein
MRNKRKPSPSFTSPLGPQAAANTMADTLAAVFDGSLLPNNNSTTQHNINNNTPLDINTHPPPFTLATTTRIAQITKQEGTRPGSP